MTQVTPQLTPEIERSIAQHVTQISGHPFEIHDRQPISGGDINLAYKLSNQIPGQPHSQSPHSYFLKINHADRIEMFEAEAEALRQLQATHTIRVPTPICTGTADAASYIVLEFLDLRPIVPSYESGRQLARLHQVPGLCFGWTQSNTIGLTPQSNFWTKDWAEFWQGQRIGIQLDMAHKKGARFRQGDRLLNAIPDLLTNHKPTPALVHGDLWGGNAGMTRSGEPVIFDPALYWGDREVDLAMTELFGGFSPEFYAGYNEVYPIDPGYSSRKDLYNLYHILNHYNLFGGSYAKQADRLIDRLVTQMI